jgi:methionyl-tRNA synthetase
MAAKLKKKQLNVRTTDKGHEQRAALIWDALKKDIYKATYEGLYCTGCEAYVTEAQAKENNGVCPHHNKPYELLKEENYFFKLSSYSEKIAQAIENGSFRILPVSRKHEIQHVIKEGLEDISISRPKNKISWGIPVPGDKDQVMYVWFEALMNYITVLGYPEHEDFKKFWPANVQVVGKDILRFHAAIWPGMLLALELPLPKSLYVHGFISGEGGQKMSKSLGNVVAPSDLLAKYSADAVRYYLLRHIPSYGDGEFSWQKLQDAYNTELANELGNAVQRTAVMINKYQDGIIGNVPPAEHDIAEYEKAMEDCRFDKALEEVWEQVRGINKYIEEQKPWEIAKTDSEHLKEVLAYQVSALLQIADLLEPFMPGSAQKIQGIFNEGVIRPIEGTLFPKKEEPTS